MRKEIKIDIGVDFNNVLGHRYRDKGKYSGQEFYEEFLLPKYKEVLEKDIKLHIDLSNVLALPPSFLSESFGKLSITYGANQVKKMLKFTAINKERFIDKVLKVIDNPYDFILG